MFFVVVIVASFLCLTGKGYVAAERVTPKSLFKFVFRRGQSDVKTKNGYLMCAWTSCELWKHVDDTAQIGRKHTAHTSPPQPNINCCYCPSHFSEKISLFHLFEAIKIDATIDIRTKKQLTQIRRTIQQQQRRRLRRWRRRERKTAIERKTI